MAYKPTKRQNEQLRRAVSNFNRQIDRLNKHYQSAGDAPIIPEKRSVKQIRQNITNYNEFRRELAALNRLSKGKAKDEVEFNNVKMLRYDVNQLKYDLRQANKQRAKFRDIIGYNQMRTDTENLRERRMPDLNKLDPKQIKEFMKSVRSETTDIGQEKRLELLRNNYIQGLRENLRKADFERIADKVRNTDLITFANAYVNDQIEDLEFVYGNEKQKAQRIESAIDSIML